MKAVANVTPRINLSLWLPSIGGGLIAWLIFIILGETPLIRATGLGLAIVGVILTLRRMESVLAVAGGLALAFSPVFWSQTGGGASIGPATIVIAVIIALLTGVTFTQVLKRPYIAIGLGLLVFAIIYWSQIGLPRSLRLTGLLTTWLLFLLVDAIYNSNPRPEDPPLQPVSMQQYIGILIIIWIGVINDPLFMLLIPAVAIGLWLSNIPVGHWYWLAILGALSIGIWGMINTYIDPDLWWTSSLQAQDSGLQAAYILPDGWRQGIRWVNLIRLIFNQLTLLGAILSILGMARMARWYPLLGVTLMIGYGFYFVFGLVYFGSDRQILLIPLFIIQIIWLTYGIHTFGEWMAKSQNLTIRRARWMIFSMYYLLPAYFLFTRITST